MNAIRVSILAVALTMLASGVSLRATTMPAATGVSNQPVTAGEYGPMSFSDSAEAGMLHRAYQILATGDHDYKGHRARAMRQVKAAAEMLGLNLRGDVRDREKQALSDERLREADVLIGQVLGSAEVNSQAKVTKHLQAARNEIHAALRMR